MDKLLIMAFSMVLSIVEAAFFAGLLFVANGWHNYSWPIVLAVGWVTAALWHHDLSHEVEMH